MSEYIKHNCEETDCLIDGLCPADGLSHDTTIPVGDVPAWSIDLDKFEEIGNDIKRMTEAESVPARSPDWEKEFDLRFDKKHTAMHHLSKDDIRRKDCEVCKSQKLNNPKGYVKTFLTENTFYWNDSLYKDVKAFIQQVYDSAYKQGKQDAFRNGYEVGKTVGEMYTVSELEAYKQGCKDVIGAIEGCSEYSSPCKCPETIKKELSGKFL